MRLTSVIIIAQLTKMHPISVFLYLKFSLDKQNKKKLSPGKTKKVIVADLEAFSPQ